MSAAPEDARLLRLLKKYAPELLPHFVSGPEDENKARRRDYQRRWEWRKRREAGIPEAVSAGCGTRSGYNRHVTERLDVAWLRDQLIEAGFTIALNPDDYAPCDQCLAVNAAYQRQRRAASNAYRLLDQYREAVQAGLPSAEQDERYEQVVAVLGRVDHKTATKIRESLDATRASIPSPIG